MCGVHIPFRIAYLKSCLLCFSRLLCLLNKMKINKYDQNLSNGDLIYNIYEKVVMPVVYHSWLNCCLGCWHSIWVLVRVPVTLLLTYLPADAGGLGKAARNGPSVSNPLAHVRNSDEAPGSWFLFAPVLAVAVTCGVNQQVEEYLSLFQNK